MMYELMASIQFPRSVIKGGKSSIQLEVQPLLTIQILLRFNLESFMPLQFSYNLPKPYHFRYVFCTFLKYCRQVMVFVIFSISQYARSTLNRLKYAFLMVIKPQTSNLCLKRVHTFLIFSPTISISYFICRQPTQIESSSSSGNSRNCLKSWKGLHICLRMMDLRAQQMRRDGDQKLEDWSYCWQMDWLGAQFTQLVLMMMVRSLCTCLMFMIKLQRDGQGSTWNAVILLNRKGDGIVEGILIELEGI